jgi:hypothetical protein
MTRLWVRVLLLTAAGIASLAAVPAGAIRLAPAIVDQCPKEASKTSASLDARVKLLWERFEASLYTFRTAPQTSIDALTKYWPSVYIEWERYVMSNPGAPADLSALRQAVVTYYDGVDYLSNAQLDLLECFLLAGPDKLDRKELSGAIKALALGANASDTTSLSGRMNDLKGWFEWTAFSTAYFAIVEASRSPLNDRNWRELERALLYGALLHAHHDTYTGNCPAPGDRPCYRQLDLKPRGLNDTSQDGIWRFCFETLDQDAVREETRKLAHQVITEPRLLPARLPPQLR